jgi:cobalt-precorrin-5B (C1)-methyltransferase
MPDGSCCEIALQAGFFAAGRGIGWVRKEAGDDPDVTDQALFKVAFYVSRQAPGPFDLTFVCGRSRLVVRGVGGLGLVTRPGLDAEVGRWAVNPVPKKMLVENLVRAGLGRRSETCHLEVSIPDGRRLAAKTLNPVLGVIDGLSILGTSGYVEPYSHAAYIKTIEILLAGARRAGCCEVALCTGGRTARAVERDCPRLPAYAIVRIADFIADSLKLAAEFGFAGVIVGCMAGKLYKYAAGFEYTHAHTVRHDCGELAEIASRVGIGRKQRDEISRAGSVREAFSRLSRDEIELLEEELGRRALAALKKWLGSAGLELRLYTPAGELKKIWKG